MVLFFKKELLSCLPYHEKVEPPVLEPENYVEVSLLFYGSITNDMWDRLEGGISPAEREKAGRFISPEDKRASVAAHWLKRQMLSRANPAIDPLSWEFVVGAHGKPHIAESRGLHFNLSHCRGLVACALRRGGPVGIDVEFTGRPAPREIVAHYFSATEAAWLHAQPEALMTKAFFSIWTMKEAFVKATGDGLSQPLQAFSVSVDNLALLPQALTCTASSWRFHRSEPSDQHLLPIAWCNEGACIETVEIEVIQPEAWLESTRE